MGILTGDRGRQGKDCVAAISVKGVGGPMDSRGYCIMGCNSQTEEADARLLRLL